MAIVDRTSVQEISGIVAGQQIYCTECRAWAWVGQYVRHAKRCDAPIVANNIPVAPVAPVAAEKQPSTAGQIIADMEAEEKVMGVFCARRHESPNEPRLLVSRGMPEYTPTCSIF